MKKLSIILTAAVLFFSASAFAGTDNVSEQVKAAFQKEFLEAKNVQWKQVNEFYFATFKMDNSDVEAAYNENGELVAISREIKAAQLPLGVSMALAKKYEGYTIARYALELNLNGETFYYISAGNDKRLLKLKCDTNGNISVESKKKIK